MYQRLLNLERLTQKRSLLLFGPRATGKSTLVRRTFPKMPFYDLLDARTFGRLLRQPSLLEEETRAEDLVIIDEIQKLPSLLDEAHRLIAARGQRFLLTGSSARKLRRGASNLLAGRAHVASLFPLTSREITDFSLAEYLKTGGLPQTYADMQWKADLRAYVDVYLREEVQAEGLTRNLVGFSNVLDALSLGNGEELNASAIASDTGVQSRTVLNYVEVLEDTLLAFRLPVFRKTKKRKPTSHAKLYFFDLGVTNALCRRWSLEQGSEAFGKAFEHFILLETRAWNSYGGNEHELSFWRTSSGFEVDLVIGEKVAVEIKATVQVHDRHLKGLRALKEEQVVERSLVVSQDPQRRMTPDGIEILPWRDFLDELWGGGLMPA